VSNAAEATQWLARTFPLEFADKADPLRIRPRPRSAKRSSTRRDAPDRRRRR
jgi:hypothetical protein